MSRQQLQETSYSYDRVTRDLGPVAAALGESPPAGWQKRELRGLLPYDTGIDNGTVCIFAKDKVSPQHCGIVRADGTVEAEPRLVREALTLIAMCEMVTEHYSVDALARACEALTEIHDLADGVRKKTFAGDSPGSQTSHIQLTKEGVNARLQLQLCGTAIESPTLDGNHAVVYTARNLDQSAVIFNAAEEAFTALERAADKWSDEVGPTNTDAMQQLWTAMGVVRHDFLRAPFAQVIDSGRRAGDAMFEQFELLAI